MPEQYAPEQWRLDAEIIAQDEAYAARALRELNHEAEKRLHNLVGNPEMQEPFLRIMDYAQKCNARIVDALEIANSEAKAIDG